METGTIHLQYRVLSIYRFESDRRSNRHVIFKLFFWTRSHKHNERVKDWICETMAHRQILMMDIFLFFYEWHIFRLSEFLRLIEAKHNINCWVVIDWRKFLFPVEQIVMRYLLSQLRLSYRRIWKKCKIATVKH